MKRRVLSKLHHWWEEVGRAFGLCLSLIVVVSIGFAVALIEADSAGSDRRLARWPRVFGAGAEGASGMMSTIAGSIMTVIGVTFSMILDLPEHLSPGVPADGDGPEAGGQE